MNRINGYTPKQLAHDLVVGWIREVHDQHTADLQPLTDAQRREVKKHLARLHDNLLSASGLDGNPLSD